MKKQLSGLAMVAFCCGGANAVDAPVSVDGVWQTDGYGYVVEVKGEKVSLYENTTKSCLQSALATGALTNGAAQNIEAQFAVTLPGFIDAQMEVRKGSADDEKILHRSDTNTYMTAKRLKGLPEQCTAIADGGQAATRAAFWQTFREHYPFFGITGVDWQARQPNDEVAITSEEELFSSFVDMMAPLKDSHTALVAPSIDQMYFGAEQAAALSEEDKSKATAIINEQYIGRPLTYYLNQQIAFAPLKNGAGYLRINGFFDYSETGTHADDMNALTAVLDVIFSEVSQMPGLVIDIRTNSGGSDFLALELASRLTVSSYQAYAKQAVRSGLGQLSWTAARPSPVHPSSKPRYAGPIVLLSGPDTISAAETFTMAMMERTPEVTRVGANTRGSFSDMLPRALPNGWLFALPNERYIDKDEKSYDFSGIPPHIETSVFSGEDIAARRDSALDAAIELLKNAS